MNDWLRSLTILGATLIGVATVTLVLVGFIVPSPVDPSLAEATAEPTFDLTVGPDRVGGRLTVTGDRPGTLVLDSSSGTAVRYVSGDDGGVNVMPDEEPALQGPDGHIRFDRDTGEVIHIAYDGLSFYLDQGDCTLTPGARHEDTGMIAALLECPEIIDVRDQGVITIEGVIALSEGVLGGRGDLPPTGGSVDVAGTTIEYDEAEMFFGGEVLDETGRVPVGIFVEDRNAHLGFEYDRANEELFLTEIGVGDAYIRLAEPCPLTVDELGRLNQQTTVGRLTIDCDGVELPEGDTGTVEGSVVVDFIDDGSGELEPGDG